MVKATSIAWLALLLAAASSAQTDRPREGEGMVSLDFHDVDIQDVAKSISEITGKNFLLDDRARGKISVISPSPLPVADAFNLFKSALEMKNLGLVDMGKFYKIVPLREVKGSRTEVSSDCQEIRATGEEVITCVVAMQYISANEIRQALNPLVSKTGSIVAYGPSNALMLTDSAANIQRLLKVVGILDRPGARATVELIPLRHSDANDVAQKLTNIFEKARERAGFRRRTDDVEPGETVSKIMPDVRTNSIIVVATREGLDKVLDLVAELDRKVVIPKGAGRVHVRYIQHADAAELAGILSGLISGEGGAGARKKPGAKPGSPGARRGFSSAAPLPWEEGGAANPDGEGPGAATPAQEPSVAAGTGAGMFEDEVRIVADPATNSLIVTATPADYASLSAVIDQLDVSRPQVFVEALIMEVSLDKMAEVGVSGHSGAMLSTLGLLGVSNPGGALSTLALGTEPAKAGAALAGQKGLLIGGVNTKTISVGGIKIPLDAFTFRASQLNKIINVLSAPNILTTDNKKASIMIGRKVPIKSSQYLATGGGAPVEQFSREDVGLQLDVTPHINEGDEVTLEIEQKIGEVDSSEELIKAGVVTTRERTAKTTVVAQNGQTIVIGGLIREKDEKTVQRVPVLGDIPLLGYLFRQTTVTREKINLLLFLTPHVIHEPADITRVSVKKNRERQKFNKAHGIPENRALYDYELDKGLNMAPPPPRAKKEEKVRPRFEYDVPSDEERGAAPEEEVSVSRRRAKGGAATLTSAEYQAIGRQAETVERPRGRARNVTPGSNPFAEVRPPSSSD